MFKPGDIVEVNGTQDALAFNKAIGVVVCTYPLDEGDLIGVDFLNTDIRLITGSYFTISNPIESFHDLQGALSTKSGYWVIKKFLKLHKREKTGFGKFIEKIEDRSMNEPL